VGYTTFLSPDTTYLSLLTTFLPLFTTFPSLYGLATSVGTLVPQGIARLWKTSTNKA
jgi:hypothetical protein